MCVFWEKMRKCWMLHRLSTYTKNIWIVYILCVLCVGFLNFFVLNKFWIVHWNLYLINTTSSEEIRIDSSYLNTTLYIYICQYYIELIAISYIFFFCLFVQYTECCFIKWLSLFLFVFFFSLRFSAWGSCHS